MFHQIIILLVIVFLIGEQTIAGHIFFIFINTSFQRGAPARGLIFKPFQRFRLPRPACTQLKSGVDENHSSPVFKSIRK